MITCPATVTNVVVELFSTIKLVITTTTDSSKSLPSSVGSVWSPVAFVVVLVMVFPPCPASTVPSMVKVALAPLANVPTAHTPVPAV